MTNIPLSVPNSDPVPGQDGRGIYVGLAAKDGVWRYKPKGSPAYRDAESVTGILTQITMRWDDGNPSARIPARFELHVTLDEARAGTEILGRAELQIGAPVTFYTTVEKLFHYDGPAVVYVRTSPSTRDGDTSCFLEFQTWDGVRWRPLRYDEHPFHFAGDGTEKYEQALERIREHPLFVDSESGERAPDSKAAADRPVSGSANEGANPAASAPGADVRTPQAPKVFGWELKRIPKDEHWTAAPTDKQPGKLAEAQAAAGFPDSKLTELLAAIGREMGRPQQFNSMAGYAIAYDLLSAAAADPALDSAVRSGLDEYDPFADE